jgi:hypothetical protein
VACGVTASASNPLLQASLQPLVQIPALSALRDIACILALIAFAQFLRTSTSRDAKI